MEGVAVVEPPQQRGKGRPKVGGFVPGMNLGDELVERIERWMARQEVKHDRTAAIKTLLTRQLDAEERRSGKTYEALVPRTRERVKFKSLSTLAVRLGGTTYEVQPPAVNLDAPGQPVRFRVVVIKNGTRRMFDVHVPEAAVGGEVEQ